MLMHFSKIMTSIHTLAFSQEECLFFGKLVFMKRTAGHIIIFIVFPILFGGVVYILSRPNSILMFDWFNRIGIGVDIINIRNKIDLNNYLHSWIIFNFPAWIWSFSFTVALGIIWGYVINSETIHILLIPTVLGILSEIFQKINLINGTFDFLDIVLYVIGGLSGIFVIKLLYHKHKTDLT